MTNKLIDEAFPNVDWEAVHQRYVDNDWRWGGLNDVPEFIPSVDQIKGLAQELLNSVHQARSRPPAVSSGRLSVFISSSLLGRKYGLYVGDVEVTSKKYVDNASRKRAHGKANG